MGLSVVETRLTLDDKIAAWRASKGETHREELSDAAHKLFDRVGAHGLGQMRFAPPGAGRPTNDEVLSRGLDEREWAALLRGEGVRDAVFKGKDLQAETLSIIYTMIMEPFVWFWGLPAISDAHVKRFGVYARKWCIVYMPYGLPIMDHLAMLGVALSGLFDAFRRKRAGEDRPGGPNENEAPKYGTRKRKAVKPKPKEDAEKDAA